MDTEIWKDIPGWEGYYQASNLGRIKRLGGTRGAKNGRIKKYSISTCGYCLILLYKNNKWKAFSVHRLVYLSFHGKIDLGMMIHHRDGNKINNRIENLEMVTRIENFKAALDAGLWRIGENGTNAKLKIHQVVKIIRDFNKNIYTYAEIAKMNKTTFDSVRAIVVGRTWKRAIAKYEEEHGKII